MRVQGTPEMGIQAKSAVRAVGVSPTLRIGRPTGGFLPARVADRRLTDPRGVPPSVGARPFRAGQLLPTTAAAVRPAATGGGGLVASGNVAVVSHWPSLAWSLDCFHPLKQEGQRPCRPDLSRVRDGLPSIGPVTRILEMERQTALLAEEAGEAVNAMVRWGLAAQATNDELEQLRSGRRRPATGRAGLPPGRVGGRLGAPEASPVAGDRPADRDAVADALPALPPPARAAPAGQRLDG